ncbi:MAG TPA: formylmethanofuran dehydrogenase subunit A [Candidatus Syntrophoarchaeum butanivorans]|uniref:Formylmethanofuran dehydrogenase subunit A n=1 Tax=Candidatus Syntropharchaeum butanivorans TaxID=1839936 RepID=A0A1F2P7A5_9EURY|nr:MAG: formylmethanofuran dehydrogenase subunit A [Candidatus Syntrophoarchaeum butanivorans]HEC57040.1 formylmethanofuran dehydrogenase subunit A [Candidatus Syntrophoarchaeum butanivorans]
MGILIKNGVVYDPAQGIYGEKMDISIDGDKIVEDVSSPERVIDAEGRLVVPGGVELHSHIAGGKVNAGRIMRPEDGRKGRAPRGRLTRACSGFSILNTFSTGYTYARMGYTTTFEAAMPPLLARHTHEEFEDMPITDKGALVLLDNNWMTMEYVKAGDLDRLAAYVSWMFGATKAYGIKIVNPGGVEAWGWGKNCSINDPVPHFDVTPKEIIRALAKVNEELKLPHSIHIHCNDLGHPGNFETTLETYEAVKDITASSDRQVMHATHTQFHAYGGSSWKDFESKADAIADYVNKNDHITIDLGAVMFCDTTTMTADGPMEYSLHTLSRRKWSNHDVELETGSGIIPVAYSPKVPVNAIQWAVGIELALLIEDPWKVVLTTDHPNGCPFTFYPEIIALLMSKPKREEMLKGVSDAVGRRALIATIDRELTWGEIITMTRSAPAKILGLSESKGTLRVGADADVAIYDIMPESFDPAKGYREIEEKLMRTFYTVKGGEVVVKDGEIVATPPGRTYWVNPVGERAHAMREEMLKDLEAKFDAYYTVSMANYPVQDEYLSHPLEIRAG